MSGPNDFQYDSTGAGEMVKSDQSQFMYPIARPGGNAVDPAVTAGEIPGIGQNMAPESSPRATPAAPAGDPGGFASDGGSQRIP